MILVDVYCLKFHCTGDATEYSKHFFRALDTNNDKKVSFKEVMIGFHHLSPQGNQDERLKIVFKV